MGILYGCSSEGEDVIPLTTGPQKPTESTQNPATTTPEATPVTVSFPKSENYIPPEELNSIVEGTGGGYDFSVPFDSDKWVQVDDKNTFVMKFERVDSEFPWTATSIQNAFVTMTFRDSQYDYIVMKFIKPNTETLVVFEAVNEDGVVGSSLGDAPEGIYFAVAIGQ